MKLPSLVNDCTLLSRSIVYRINGHSYYFDYSYSSGRGSYYKFVPLPSQRVFAPLLLGASKVYRTVYETDVLRPPSSRVPDIVQPSLF